MSIESTKKGSFGGHNYVLIAALIGKSSTSNQQGWDDHQSTGHLLQP